MKIKIANILLLSLALIAIPGFASAYQPQIIDYKDVPIVVERPEISKSYFGKLNGKPHEYIIKLDIPVSLDVVLSVPDVPGAKKDFVVSGVSLGETIFQLDAEKAEWKPYFDNFGHDNYLVGPEESTDLVAGTYSIIVENPDNVGSYVLTIGNKEAFPFAEAINSILTIPKIKQQFFNKPIWDSLESPYVSVPVGGLVVILLVGWWLIKR